MDVLLNSLVGDAIIRACRGTAPNSHNIGHIMSGLMVDFDAYKAI